MARRIVRRPRAPRNPDGRRSNLTLAQLLLWIPAVIFWIGAGWAALDTRAELAARIETRAEVLRSPGWPGETPFDRGQMQYAPVFAYQLPDGTAQEASTDIRHPDWNYEPGSLHTVLILPDRRGPVMLPGRHNWAVANILLNFALGTSIAAFLLGLLLRRRKSNGVMP